MARIGEFREVTSQTNRLHSPVECGYRIFTVEGQTLLQLDTYGSTERKDRGSISQSVQLDEEAAETLAKLIVQAFPAVRRSIT